MFSGDLLSVRPLELKFHFEVNKQSSCSMQLTNRTEQYVAFKIKTTNPKRYCVRPNTGIVLPGMTCDVTVTMQAQKEAPPDLQCKDKFLVQSVVVENGATLKDPAPEMFNKVPGKLIEEVKMRVVYLPANPPSPVPEGSEEGRLLGPPHWTMWPRVSSPITKLTEEKGFAIQQNQKLRQELEMLRKDLSRSKQGGFSIMVVLLVGILGILAGYAIKKSENFEMSCEGK
ncbi:unnamed protein product [Spirodela intermedia]|uniref:MSP domain-containing protein n=1 Tax=Spirodela intermedia TaxID=51605 RepID=A0A7I8IEG6_SPIIN|nr:unnamed protein product [Spirodela intermedia]CAA6656187.1 unnamed protein product [Spirodela intermedia]